MKRIDKIGVSDNWGTHPSQTIAQKHNKEIEIYETISTLTPWTPRISKG